MKTLHIVSGGIGKTIIFTSLLKKLKEKYNKNISLHTMYNEIYDNHYAVDKIIPTFEYFNYSKNKTHLKEYDSIINHDPYYSNYVFNDISLKESYFNMYELDYENDENDIEITRYSKNIAKHSYNSKYFIFQFTGGQSMLMDDYNDGMFGMRNYSFNRALKLVSELSYSFPDIPFLDFSHSNEYNFNFSNVFKYYGNFIGLQTILKNSIGFLSIDSSLQHLAATKQIKKRGIVLWNTNITTPEKIGYKDNINLTFNGFSPIEINEQTILEQVESLIYN
jgi:hypothetical protein